MLSLQHNIIAMHIRTFLLLVLLCVSLSTKAYSDHRNRKVDSLEHVLRTHPPTDKTELIRIYDNLAWGYLEINEQASTRYADLGIALAKEQKAYRSLAEFYRIKGMHHWAHARYKEAEEALLHSEEATVLMRESGQYEQRDIDDAESALYGTLGNLYNTLGNGSLSLHYYHKALKIFKAYEWRESESICYGNMADLYYCMGNLSCASAYYEKGDSVAKLTEDVLTRSFCQRGLAKVAMQQGHYDKAWQLIGEVWKYVSAHPDEEGSSRAECLQTMTDIAFAQGDYQQAEQLIQQNLALGEDMHSGDAGFYCQLAQLSMHKGRWAEARTYAVKALGIDDEAPDVAKENYNLLADIYAHLGEADSANMFRIKADSIQTAWSNYAYQTSLAEQESRFHSEEKDTLIDSLSSQRVYLLWAVGCVLLLLLLLGLIVLFIRYNHKRQKALLAVKVALEAEAKERSLLAQELHDGLGSMLSLLKLKLQHNHDDDAMRLLDESVIEMRRVAHHLMPEELRKNGLVTSLQDFAISVPGAQFHYFGDKRRLPREIEFVIYRCAYELVNNAIKHAAAERIDIQLMDDHHAVVLTVSDNGRGMDDARRKHSGVGLQNIRNRITQYDGKMDIISSPDHGTEINVTIPLKE